ncbi:hypothetical protein MACK_002985 [Theileria orientalis]|uniref:B-block binding subunit of TFIIIC domain-containing protein n=1 Tax=Theileria orientalis TaxID=68886 RepID=A0A976MFH2_THEOR|nr:hypothetical protein MACK_002985 [Theileria orientalis]
MIESENIENFLKRCKCNSSKCYINKGLFITEIIEDNQGERKKLHKFRCCKLCNLKYMRECERKNTVEIKESSVKSESKTKMETKSKDSKKSKSTSSEKKGSIVQDLKKNGIISKDLWNYSTKVTKADTNKTQYLPIKKQTEKKISTTLKIPSTRCTTIKKESVSKEKGEPVAKKVSTKEKSKSKEVKEVSAKKKDKKLKEPIYISYSLNGFIKIKSTKDIVVFDKYYQESGETRDNLCCECPCCETEQIQDDNQCYMDLNKLEELSLEYLSTQIEPIDYLLLYSRIFEENALTVDKISVELWLRLYSNRDILIIVNEEFDEYLRLNYPLKQKTITNSLYDIDVTEFADTDLESHIGKTKLLCSNTFRIKRLNLGLYEQVVKSNERFRLLMAIASKRYSGYWQSDLVEDLKLTPKDLFSLLSCLCRFGLVYKLTIPQNSIYRYLIDNINENFDIKYDTKEDGQETDKDSSIKNSASICFFHKYFVIDKLPENLKALCFSEVTRNCELTMLEVLEKAQNNIMLESDWRRSYFNTAFGELSQFNIKVENHLITKSYMSLKKSLETKNKVALIFAWCPQTNKYERSVMLLKNQKDNILRLKRTSMVHVINMKTEEKDDEDSDDEPLECVKHDLRGHSLQEYLYYLIKTASDGISAKGIHNHIASKYKSLAKILLHMEAVGLIRKQTHRDGKVFMYKYYTKDSRSSIVKIEDSSDDSCKSSSTQYEMADEKMANSMAETPINANSNNSGLFGTKYIDFINSQKMKYYDDSIYLRDFESMFSGTVLLRAVNTINFKRRMVMMNNYLEYFKAATHTNLSKYISDMEGRGSRPDRKSIIRISDRVLKKMTHFKSIKCDHVKGSNMTLTVMYDSRHFTELEAYDFLRKDINEKRILICSKSAQMKTKINDHFKNPDHVKNIAHEAVEIINSSNSNVGNLKMPLLVKDVSVNQQNTNVNFDDGMLFSQRRLSLNGYVFPIMTRVKMLHGFLIQNFRNETFTTSQVLKAMTLENYFQLIGCGYHISNVVEYMNERIANLPHEHINILTNKRRDPINILNNQLNFLYRIKLLSFTSESEGNFDNESVNVTDSKKGGDDVVKTDSKSLNKNNKKVNASNKRKLSDFSDDTVKSIKKVESSKTELKWKIIRYVYLYDYVLNEKKQKYDLYKEHQDYWHNFKVQVDEYVTVGNGILPKVLPVKEVFSKKNWKKAIYLNTIVKTELDRVITLWMDLCCSGLHAKSQTKLCHIPYKVIRVLCDRFNLTKTQIQSQLKSKLRVYTCESQAEDDRILNKILSNIYKGSELLWISRYVIAEKIANRIFLNILHNNPHTLPRINELSEYCKIEFSHSDGNGSSDNGISDKVNRSSEHENSGYVNGEGCTFDNRRSSGNLPDVWKYLNILFKYKYSENECKVIFDYIINKSTINLRVLKKLRRLKTSEIIRYTSKKSYTNITNTYNTASTNFDGGVQVKDDDLKSYDNQIEYLSNKLRLKCTMFTSSSKRLGPAVSVHQDIKYYKKILKTWNEYGWLVRCKKRSMILKVFKLSIMSKLKLFPKYTQIYFYGNQLLSYMDLNNHDNFTPSHQPYKTSGGIDNYVSVDGSHVDTSSNFNKVSIISNCLEMDIHNIYNMVEKFNEITFDMKWTFQAQKEDKTNYYRLIDGGISKHIKTLTTNIGVSQVKANITNLQTKLNDQNYKRGLNTLRILPKLYVCIHEASDLMDPVVFCNEPLNSSPLVNEVRNDEIAKKMMNSISDVLIYVRNIYGADFSVKVMEKGFHKLIKTVKSSCVHGIGHSALIMAMENKKTNSEIDTYTRIDDNTTNNNNIVLYKILINTALILRLMFMIPNGNEFIYLYWEYSEKIMINTPCFCKTVIKDSVSGGRKKRPVVPDEEDADDGEDEDDGFYNDIDNDNDQDNESDCEQNDQNDDDDDNYDHNQNEDDQIDINDDQQNDNFDHEQINNNEDETNSQFISSNESTTSGNQTGSNSEESTQNCNIISDNDKKETSGTRERSRPDYISEIFWLIFQKNSIQISDNIEEFTMPIKDLLKDDLEGYKKALDSSQYSPFTVLDGCFNIHMVAFISLKIYSIVKEKPGLTVHEVWKDMAILDECEVELLIESLISLKIVLYKQIIVETESNHIFSSNKNINRVKRVLYPQETSAALLNFKSILLVR